MNVLLIGRLFAQGLEVHGALSAPISDFGNKSLGGAATGFGFGLKYMIPLNANTVYFNLGSDFYYHDINQNLKDANSNLTYYKYMNVPITTGFTFHLPVNNKISLFGETNIGLNVGMRTKASGIVNDDSGNEYTLDETYSPAVALSYKIGAGIIFDFISIGAYYNNMGSVKNKFTDAYSDGSTSTGTCDAVKISTFDIVLGFRLFKSDNKHQKSTESTIQDSNSSSGHGGRR